MSQPSVCPLDCPDRCSLDVEVEADRITAVRGSRKNPLTAGYICAKVADSAGRVHGPRRVRAPAIRVGPKGGGAWREVSWDEAIDTIARRFSAIIARSGPEAILPCWYGGSNGYLTSGGMDARFWNRLGASRPMRTLCATNAAAAARLVYTDLPSADVQDVVHARLIVVWGNNPSASGIHLVPLIRKARRAGARLVVIDPVRTPLAAEADLHLAPLPGTDLALALALHQLAFSKGYADRAFLAEHAADASALESFVAPWTAARAAAETGVSAEQVEALADLLGAARPAVLRVGWGLERTRNGVDAIRAAIALPAVYGTFGERGGGYVLSTSPGYRPNLAPVQQVGGASRAREYNLSQLGRAIEELRDPPAEAVYVYNNNPVATVPDQARVVRALSREDLFVVVHEQVWTDTCALADVVLPATTFFEHRELSRSYGSFLFQWSEPVIPPVGEARNNHAVFAALARALGMDEPEFAEDEPTLAEKLLDGFPAAKGGFAELRDARIKLLPRPVQFGDTFPSRPIRLCDPPYQLRPPPEGAELPLILISPATPQAISSTGYEDLKPDGARLVMHPVDAAARGLEDGDRVRAFNGRGEVRVTLSVSDEVRPGVVTLPKGLWRTATANGWTANVLVPDHVAEIGAGACYNDARVEVEGLGHRP